MRSVFPVTPSIRTSLKAVMFRFLMGANQETVAWLNCILEDLISTGWSEATVKKEYALLAFDPNVLIHGLTFILPNMGHCIGIA